MSAARFIGVGVSEYDKGHPRLDHAVPDVNAVAGLLAETFGCTVLSDPEEETARDCMRKLRGSMPDGGRLVLLWNGHAIPSPADGLRLLARDSQSYQTDGLGAASDVAGPCAESGANQILIIIDTCFSGEGVTAADVAARILQRTPPDAEHVWVGVLTSCLPTETARDGIFSPRLAKLLQNGPETPELRVRWSPHSAFVRGDDLCDAMLKDWDSSAQSPDFIGRGSAWWIFPNPLYNPGAPEQVVEHLLLAARGGAVLDERSWFTGRIVEVNQVVAWVRSDQPGLHVIAGSAGTGKTAIAGRVVSLSNPAERTRLLSEGRPLEHADPGERAIDAHLHARGLTADSAADVVAAQLVQASVLAAQPDRRNAAELVGQVQRAVEFGAAPPVIVVDGLDEARSHAFAIAEDLLLRLAPYAVVIVATRELRRSDTEASLLDELTAGSADLDLDDPVVQERGRADMRAYITARLAGVNPRMNPETVARHLTDQASMTGSEPFLLARLVTDQLRAVPVDTSHPDWQRQVSRSIEGAFDTDLARVRTLWPSGRAEGTVRTPTEAARILVAGLTWTFGAGLPEEEWLVCANVAAEAEGSGFGRDDLSWLLDELGRYVIQDGEGGVAVYRLAHQSLADHIHPPFNPTYEQPFDPYARMIVAALLTRYEMLLETGVSVDEPAYLRRYSWRHAAAAGPAGLDLIRNLAAGHPELLADVAATAQEVAERLASWGHHLEAVEPGEEAARLYRQLVAGDPAFTPNLAKALNNLGIRYSAVGRRRDALGPGEEAVQLYRQLTADNPAFTPDLAMALGNLSNRYGDLGRWQDAFSTTQQVTGLYRQLAVGNPTFRPNLATALSNMSIFCRMVGRRRDALGPAEEAVRLCRELAIDNAALTSDLARALINLSASYLEAGQRQDALSPAEEAVRLYRQLAANNPAFTPNLAGALTNLSVFYGETGHWHDALGPAQEAVRLYRDLPPGNPAFTPNLAGALANLSTKYSDVGRREDALGPAEEAVRLYRRLAADNPAFTPDLAKALTNLGIFYTAVGRREDALGPAEEAVRLYRRLAADNPAFTPDLAMALNNMGGRYTEAGRRQDALDSEQEAVQLYRELAADNAAFTPNLARALTNLSTSHSQVGRREDALDPAEEAVRLYRESVVGNPVLMLDLARALTNLSARYGEVGRPENAVGPAEEAARLCRELAAGNAAFAPDLARALGTLSAQYSEVGRHEDALGAAEEAVRLYRQLAAENLFFRPNLAGTLNNLGIRYSEVGRREDALGAAEEAVQLYRELASGDPSSVRGLAIALSNLHRRYTEAGDSDRGNAAWEHAVAEAEPSTRAHLLLARASLAREGDPDAAAWLAHALRLAEDARELVAAIHEHARRHRSPNPSKFDTGWIHHTGGPVPAWLTVDSELLATAQAWVATGTYTAERDYLLAHPELLKATADIAVAEALLAFREDTVSHYVRLREAAQRNGVDAAYQPLLLTILAHEFARADTDRQRMLLASRRDDLLMDIVSHALDELARQNGESAAAAQRALALIGLARSGDVEMVFDVLAEPGKFPTLLHNLATRPNLASLAAAAVVAAAAATTAGETAIALFYLAISAVIRGDDDRAIDAIRQARQLHPDYVPMWINQCAEIGQHHPAVLQLIPALTAPADQPHPVPLSAGPVSSGNS
jgi:tetratricopeptide (TPR) repeat protein